jgi:hypothetical protein
MKNGLLALFIGLMLSSYSFSQDCFLRLQKAFDERGAYSIADDMHRNVILSFIEDGSTYCISGKCRVENGKITSVFQQYNDDTYELMNAKFFNSKKESPTIVNGISEMIFTDAGEKFKVVFIDQLKPKKKEFKTVDLPDDL